eukprot:scaffold93_cov233-Pinguiococcus_pyrenoidosus.AAC.6
MSRSPSVQRPKRAFSALTPDNVKCELRQSDGKKVANKRRFVARLVPPALPSSHLHDAAVSNDPHLIAEATFPLCVPSVKEGGQNKQKPINARNKEGQSITRTTHYARDKLFNGLSIHMRCCLPHLHESMAPYVHSGISHVSEAKQHGCRNVFQILAAAPTLLSFGLLPFLLRLRLLLWSL